MPDIFVQRETDDWVQKTFTEEGTTYTGLWSSQIVAYGARPTGTWVSSVTNGGDKGFNIEGLATGYYHVYYRMDGQSPYAPVVGPDVLVVQ